MKASIQKLALALLFCLVTLPGWAQFEGYQLSPQARISLITCSSGEDLYSVFGHSAVRVNDPISGLDVVFNYGTFDFDEPNFYLKFARGKLNYKLSVAHFQDFIYSYVRDNRSVYQQELNLTPEQRQRYWGFLTNNYLPANRFYLYDFFFDNCATRIRDGLEAALPNQIAFSISDFDEDYSFRNLIDLYLPPQPWGDFGIDLALGARIDQEATPYEYMFLPEYLSKGFANAAVARDGGEVVPLTLERQVIFEREPIPFEAGFFTPLVVCWALLVIVAALTVRDLLKGRRSRLFDIVFFLLFGLLGVLLLLLWAATDHEATAWNMNLLWAIPTHAVVAFFLGRQVLAHWVQKYMLYTALLAGVLLLGWPFWPQNFHAAFLPLVVALGLRAAYAVWFSKKAIAATPQKSVATSS